MGWLDELVARLFFEHTEAEYQMTSTSMLFKEMQTLYRTEVAREELAGASLTREELIEEFQEDAQDAYAAKVEEYGAELLRDVERYSSSRSWTCAGASTSSRWSTSATSPLVPWPRRTLPSTARRATRCSRS